MALTGNDKTPGCSAAVGHDGKVVWEDQVGRASTASPKPITATTRLDIASTSKQFTAAAVLDLVIKGKMSEDDRLNQYFPDFPSWAKDVTIFQLLHHTSGVPEYEEIFKKSGITYAEVTTNAQAIEAISKAPALDFKPGSDFSYSNSNYVLLADIIRMVTGTPFPEYITKTIFKPLGLKMILDPGPDVPNKATSYFLKDGKYVDATSGWLQLGDGEIQTAPSQLVTWADNYRTGTFGGQELLKLQLQDAVPVGDKLGPNAKAYGAGIWEEKNGRLAHTGGWEGFSTTFLISRDRHYAFAMTCNYTPSDPKDLATWVQAIATIVNTWFGPDN